MRVLHVIAGLPKAAGTSVFCVELCHALNQEPAGCHINAAGMTDAGHPPSSSVSCVIAVCDPGVPDMYQPEGQPPGKIPLVSIKEVLQAAPSFDLFHLHALWHPALHQVVRYAKRHRIPYVFSPHGMLTPWALGQKPLKKWMALALYQYRDLRGAALIHVTAECELTDVRRLGLKQPAVVAPLGVNVPSEAPAFLRNNPRIALFVSRIHPKKGLFNLVDAWAEVKRSSLVHYCDSALVGGDGATDNGVPSRLPASPNSAIQNLQIKALRHQCTNELPPWRFVIAGPDQDGHAAAVMARARAAGVEDDFEMVGPVFGKQKDDLYVKADLFVLPTYSENFGVVVIEALAHGCPVITTKGAPWAELLGSSESSKVLKCESAKVAGGTTANDTNQANEDNFRTSRCGWWIDIGVEPLAQTLREAMSLTDEERVALGENGRCLAQAKYSWPAIAAGMRRAYDWILAGGLSPAGLRL